MSTPRFALFDTAIGRCGIAWDDRGLIALQLPEARDAATRARLTRSCPTATEALPPPVVQRAIDAIDALLRGQDADLSEIELDMTQLPPFHRRVYELTRRIPPGKTLTYGEVARRIGAPGAARAVGQALGRNPFAIVVPCHRVLAAGNKPGGFSANGGVATKLRLLALEGQRTKDQLALFDGDGELAFDTAAAVAHVRAADRTLARWIDAIGPLGLRLRRSTSLFAALSEAIVYQQLNGKAAAAIFARVRALFPNDGDELRPEQILRTSDEALRTAGLSRSKLLALRDLATRSVGQEIPTLAEARTLSDETLIERLTAVRGVGRWTVEMLLIFRLGRPDVLPAADFGIRKGHSLVYGRRELPSPKLLERHGERFRPYRSVASWYLWRAAERGAL